MERNVGGVDRIARLIVGVILAAVGFTVVPGAGGIVVGIIGIILFLTGVVAYCVLYRFLKINTYIRV